MTAHEKLPKVVLVGRANVGKSSLFNKIIETNKALISPIAGTTRDINRSIGYWNGVHFELMDTGGIETLMPKSSAQDMAPEENEDYAMDIVAKSTKALKEAEIIIFVVDGKVGPLPLDLELAQFLRRYDKKLIVAVNKIDSVAEQADLYEFMKLGFSGDPQGVSAKTSLGIGDLLDQITNHLLETGTGAQEGYKEFTTDLNVAMIGRPNVGKSSLFNKLIGEDLVIVSPMAHTTREPNDMTITYKDTDLTFIDTAGIRRKARVEKGLESSSVTKTINTIKRADIALFVIDVSQPITVQDKHLAELLLDTSVGIIIIANKWDLIEGKHTNIQQEITKEIHRDFPFLTWAPIVFTSALTGQHVHKVYDMILQVQEHRSIEVSQDVLDEFIVKATKRTKPIAQLGTSRPVILEFEQIRSRPPVFRMRIRPKDTVATAYVRYLENSLRQELGIIGTKVWVTIKK